MRIAELRAIEDFDEVLRHTLKRGWSALLGAPYSVHARGEEQDWLRSDILSACIVRRTSPEVRLHLCDTVRYTQVRSRMLPRYLAGTLASTPLAIRLMSKPCFSVTPAIENAEFQYVLPGNRRHRVFDLKQGKSWSFLKPSASPQSMATEVKLRAKDRAGPFPPILRFDPDLRWIEEPLLVGTSLTRIPFGRHLGSFEAKAFELLDDWLARHATLEPLTEYVDGLADRIHALTTDPASDSPLVRVVAQLVSIAKEDNKSGNIELSLSHGDFHPANIFVQMPSENVLLTDWEYSGQRSRYYDALGYILRGRWLSGLGQRVVDFVWRGAPTHNLELLLPANHDRSVRRTLAALFLLEELVWTVDPDNTPAKRGPSDRTKGIVQELFPVVVGNQF